MISATHLHAIIIHFPIALLMIGFLSELLALFIKKDFLKNTAFYLLLLGALGAIAAYVSGNYAGDGIEEGPLKIPVELHEQAALITLWLAIITALFSVLIYYFKIQNSKAKWAGILLYALLAFSVARTGYLGGQLVFSHGVGVELALPDFNNL
ncbi:MAG TPA: DUF2231 domain-containing protein [Lutibacter sp.]